jgi:hypothetical protein
MKEYKIEEVFNRSPGTTVDAEERLNKYALEGWILVNGSVITDSSYQHIFLFLEREKGENDSPN